MHVVRHFSLILLGAAFGFFGCKRSEMPKRLPREQLPAISFREVLAGAPFSGTILKQYIADIPDIDQESRVSMVVIEIKREDGTHFAITELRATAAQVEAMKRLVVGQTYQFPEILRETVK
jgi:hypothetical protein